MDMPQTRPSLLRRPDTDIPQPTEVRPIVRAWAPTMGDPLHQRLREGGYVRPVSALPTPAPVSVSPAPVLEALPEHAAAVRDALAARRRHQARMDMWAEARAGVWFIFALLACVILVVVGALVVGALFGSWPLPLHGAS
jgi:hypothetical protein